MYKIYGILGAEYPRPNYHRASGAMPLVRGQETKPPEAKSNFIFWTSCGSSNIMALGARAPCAPRGSANGLEDRREDIGFGTTVLQSYVHT